LWAWAISIRQVSQLQLGKGREEPGMSECHINTVITHTYTHSLPNARSCNLIKKYRRIIKEKGVNKGATHIEMAWRPHPVWSNGDVPTQTSFGIRHSAVPAIPTAGSSFPGTYFLAISRDGNDGALDVPQHRSAIYVETPPVILGGL